MEFGIFNAISILPRYREAHGGTAEHDRLMDEVAFIVAADAAGIKYAWASEHHFLTDYSHLSDSESFLAFCAAKTSNIHIGSGIFNITPPANHPARIAERVAMLDHLSEGRFEFGTGRGSSTTEQRGFGITDPELTREMVAETLPEIVRMWRDRPYSHDGTFFSMPERNVLPKPFTRPHPPIWMAAGSPSTFELAARLGVGVLCFAFTPPQVLTPLIAKYKEMVQDCTEPVGAYVNDNVMITTGLVCLEDGSAAREAVTKMGISYLQSLVYHYHDTIPPPEGAVVWPDHAAEPTLEEVQWQIDNGYLICGNPEECAEQIAALDTTGIDQLTFGMPIDLPWEQAVETLELFGDQVIPRFDTDPVHKSSHARDAAGVLA